jgi:hypothetical protein
VALAKNELVESRPTPADANTQEQVLKGTKLTLLWLLAEKLDPSALVAVQPDRMQQSIRVSCYLLCTILN